MRSCSLGLFFLVLASCTSPEAGATAADLARPPPDPSADAAAPDLPGRDGGAAPALGRVTFRPLADTSMCTRNGASPIATSQCLRGTVSACPGIADLDVYLKVSEPAGAAIGTIVLGSGGGGGAFYETFGASATDGVLRPLLQQGYRLIQRGWAGTDGWMTGPGGSLRLACRYATLIDGISADPGLHPRGALCVTGNSGGSGEIAYALAAYGLSRIIDLALPTSGPPMARIDWGCLGPDIAPWTTQCPPLNFCGGKYSGNCDYGAAAPAIDGTYGAGVTDCAMKDPARAATWLADSVLAPGAQLAYPQTEVRFIFGGQDCSVAEPFGMIYAMAITSAKRVTVVPNTPHAVPMTAAGAAQVLQDLLDGCRPRH